MTANFQSHCLPAIPSFLLGQSPWTETGSKSSRGGSLLAFQRDSRQGNFDRGSRTLLLCNITSPATTPAGTLRRGQSSRKPSQDQGQIQHEASPGSASLQTDEGAETGAEEEVPSDEGLLLPDEDVAPRRISRNFNMFCSSCRRPTARDNPRDLIECTCCHRVYHGKCYESKHSKEEGRPTPDAQYMESGQPWYHTADCEKVHESLKAVARRGDIPTATPSTSSRNPAAAEQPSRSWRLILCGSGGSLAVAAMGRVHGVLSQAGFKYGLADLNSFDAAALIRQDGVPACAAVLDVHGADAAELFVIGTRRDMRRQGLCRQMVTELSSTLGEAGVRRIVLPVDEDEDQALWRKLGFQPLESTTLRQLGWTLPAFSKDAVAGTSLLSKNLSAPWRAPWSK
ncbi:hypothetical protein DUNSADRAFT_9117 [Dunaliella salina]|uniref:N-acetyltransferase domain-containing protein n=1 Tax=Dunaliella salina TaxID=3046 RepID=A0ABQ7GIB0_DUNSA|nr:hypothetical protein DUNSADRAFT_9117 [Dunaliella salina]|eukprot:KAF5834294.1 hypothetical protein DUNSADRAFT_9117 [Dunaliella salina]